MRNVTTLNEVMLHELIFWVSEITSPSYMTVYLTKFLMSTDKSFKSAWKIFGEEILLKYIGSDDSKADLVDYVFENFPTDFPQQNLMLVDNNPNDEYRIVREMISEMCDKYNKETKKDKERKVIIN